MTPLDVPTQCDIESIVWRSSVASSYPAILEGRDKALLSLLSSDAVERALAVESFIYCWPSDESSIRLLATIAETDGSIAVRYTAASSLLILHMRAYGTDYRPYIVELLITIIAVNATIPELVDDVRMHLACWEKG
jgi:hypothetical protein